MSHYNIGTEYNLVTDENTERQKVLVDQQEVNGVLDFRVIRTHKENQYDIERE